MLTFFVCLFLARWLYHKSSWKRARLAWAVFFFLFAGCSRLGQVPVTTLSIPSITLGPKTNLANPINVNTQDSEFLWNQIVDTVEDYFQIKSEQRPTRDNTQWFEGRLETFPQIGATYLEPWRKDALEGFQRWQSTLQTMRRTANIRVIPTNEGFSVGIEVIKELEDVDRSQFSSEGSAIARHDGTIVRTGANLTGQPITLGWIRQENDADLEQRLLREILGRVSNVQPPRQPLLKH
ncbi:MAG: hypothetical protein NTU79_25230 [Planctomycetota bacterium]|nr:hypothetical protein [Planctomycetota bacterium]